MKTLLLAALAASVALCAVSAQAATFKTIAKGRALVMTGEIVPGDMERLAKAGYAAEARFANGQPVVERIFLNSPGGSVKAGLELAAFVREWGIDTVVGETDICASMCAVVFAAGMHKAVFPTSKLGVHAISTFTDEDGDGSLDENLGEDGSSLALTTVVARVMADYGVPGNIITKMMTTLQPDTYWVTAADGWTEVEVLSAAAMPNNPMPQEETVGSVSMSCVGEGGYYTVTWRTDGLWFKDKWHAINDTHQHPKTKAYVLNGPTRWGTYGAVFGGPNPRMEFSNGKEFVKDRCW